jgi:membrane glycosyltransferase
VTLRSLRAAVLVSTLALTAHATFRLSRVFPHKGEVAIVELVLVALFVPCFAWVSFGAVLAALGLVAGLRPAARHSTAGRAARRPAGDARTAVLIPMHNEDPARVAAQIEVMYRALQVLPMERHFDFFLLSDSSHAAVWLAEQVAWRTLCERLGAFGRIFYRRRTQAEGKKAGNIRDFCLRHGQGYRYLMILDADSVVTAETMCALVERMEEDPRLGILQVPPLPVRRTTLFARWQQFAARIYGPVWSAAEALLSGPDGNYFGHNAILRREAFCRHAGLGRLPGTGPLSGEIASHDFVEAALVRRAGYEVRLAPELAGSYEQCPTTLIDYAVRDKRWCQGNLQHLRVAALPGLARWSRIHLLRGACSYLVSPLSLAFASVMLLTAAHDLATEPAYFPPTRRTLFPLWPVYDFAAARSLFLWTVAILLLPRLAAAAVALVDMRRAAVLPLRRVPAFAASVLVECALGILLSPSLMLFQTVFVLAGLFGERVPWCAQRRDERRVPFAEAMRLHLPHLLAAFGLGGAALLVSIRALLWMLPLVLPLALSPLLTTLTSSPRISRWVDRLGLLQTPEDWSTSPMLAVFDAPAPVVAPSPAALLADRRACAWHALAAIGSGLVQRLPQARREELRRCLSSGKALDDAELQAVLTDAELLLELLARG